jgi:hypothetical protein
MMTIGKTVSPEDLRAIDRDLTRLLLWLNLAGWSAFFLVLLFGES